MNKAERGVAVPELAVPELFSDELGSLCRGLALCAMPLKEATREVTEKYALGPRGAWILGVLSAGPVHPLDLTKIFLCSRSLITAELNSLTMAQLIVYAKSPSDGRRVELTLTPLGEKTLGRVFQGLSRLIRDRLAGYNREELLQCSRMLNDFIGPEPLRVQKPASANRRSRYPDSHQ